MERVLAALAAQTRTADRVLIIDNGSADIAELRSRVAEYVFAELIALNDNRGFAAANNIGIARCADVDFIALLNPDAFPEPAWLEQLLAAASAYPERAAFASRLLNAANPDYLDGAGDYLTIVGKPGRRGHDTKARYLFKKRETIFGPCAAAALYRANALRTVGGFDERFFCYVEDVDLAFRLLLRGYESLYVPEAIALHVGSAVTGRRSAFAVYHGQRNLVFNYVKNMPPMLFWVFLPLHILLNITYVFAAIAIGQGNAALRAKRDALTGIGEVWKQRAYIQKSRKVSTLRVFKALRISIW